MLRDTVHKTVKLVLPSRDVGVSKTGIKHKLDDMIYGKILDGV